MTSDSPTAHDVRRIVLPVAMVATLVVTATVGIWSVRGFLAENTAQMVAEMNDVKFEIKTMSRELQMLTRAVDLGVSTFQADAWIRLFRANLQSVEPKLAPTVPDLPARER